MSEDTQEPQEGDLTTTDHISFYEVGSTRRGPALTIAKSDGSPASDKFMWFRLQEFMKAQNFFPNVWFISDHGNPHLLQPPVPEKTQKQVGPKQPSRTLA